jgi:nicotinamide-nucleotide adenylyltransferase
VNVKRALYIGRFQIVHHGHLDVVRHIDAAPDIDEILIAVGSTQYDHSKKSPVAPWSFNPFAYEERREMLERSLAGVPAKPCSIHPVPDYHDYPKWYQHIVDHLPVFECLYTSDLREKDFFSEKGKEVRRFPRVRSFHAGSIRDALARGGEYRSAVPDGALVVLDRIDAAERLRALYARDRAESQR